MKELLLFTKLEPKLSTLTFVSKQSLSSEKADLPGLVVIAELMFSPLDLVDTRPNQLPEEMQVSTPQIFIRPPEEPPRC